MDARLQDIEVVIVRSSKVVVVAPSSIPHRLVCCISRGVVRDLDSVCLSCS
jgi:hypothetical protein